MRSRSARLWGERLGLRSGGRSDSRRMEAAVDVEDLSGGRREQVGEQGDAGLPDNGPVVDVPAEGGASVPDVFEGAEARDRAGGHRANGPRRNEVDTDPVGSELARKVAGERFEAEKRNKRKKNIKIKRKKKR
jgi:hypothetical protein